MAFGPKTTTDEVLQGVDLAGKRILITGASAGIGVETSRALAAHGARIVGAVRDVAKGKRATAGVPGGVELIELDLDSLESVRACADALNGAAKPFDVIIANAGVMACPEGKTEDGFETQFGINHLGHFVLINRLAPLLHAGSRVVVLSSLAHKFSDIDLDDPNFERHPYSEFGAYGASKTANVLFAVEFDRRHKVRGVRATAVHPGSIQGTELVRHMTPEVRERQAKRMAEAVANGQPHLKAAGAYDMKTVPQGAATSCWASVVASADEIGGRYCEDCHVGAVLNDANERSGVMAYALDAARAKALWALSEKLVGETYSAPSS